MKPRTRTPGNLSLLTYLRHAVRPELDRFTAPLFLDHLYQLIRIFGALISAMFLAVLIVAHEMIGPTLLVAGLIVVPTAYLVTTLATRMVIETVIAIFIINDNVMMIRQVMQPHAIPSTIQGKGVNTCRPTQSSKLPRS